MPYLGRAPDTYARQYEHVKPSAAWGASAQPSRALQRAAAAAAAACILREARGSRTGHEHATPMAWYGTVAWYAHACVRGLQPPGLPPTRTPPLGGRGGAGRGASRVHPDRSRKRTQTRYDRHVRARTGYRRRLNRFTNGQLSYGRAGTTTARQPEAADEQDDNEQKVNKTCRARV
jgi:hypothetical protein